MTFIGHESTIGSTMREIICYEELVVGASVAAVEKETGLETVVSSLNEPRKRSIACREHGVGRRVCGKQETFVARPINCSPTTTGVCLTQGEKENQVGNDLMLDVVRAGVGVRTAEV
jgi:hypothetical protein